MTNDMVGDLQGIIYQCAIKALMEKNGHYNQSDINRVYAHMVDAIPDECSIVDALDAIMKWLDDEGYRETATQLHAAMVGDGDDLSEDDTPLVEEDG